MQKINRKHKVDRDVRDDRAFIFSYFREIFNRIN